MTPKLVEFLTNNIRMTIGEIRGHERAIMRLCVGQAGMPRKDFISSFPANETNMDWIEKHIRAKRNALLDSGATQN